MAYVVKIKYGDTLHRMILKPDASIGAIQLPYAQLEQKIRYLFKIPSGVELVLTYKDGEGDTVTISEDDDLEDALVIQGLNPLRIDVQHGESKQEEKKGEKKEAKARDARKDKEAGSSFTPEYPFLASMIEETFLPTVDSLKNIASDQLKNLSERLEQDAKLREKVFSEVFRVFKKASKKASKEAKKEEKSGEARKHEAGSSVAPDYSSFASMIEETFLPTMDSLKDVAYDQLKNLSERFEQDTKLREKVLSEVCQVFKKASKKASKEKPKSGDPASSPKEAAGNSEAAFPDAAADFCHFAPNPFQSSFGGHGSHQTDGVFHHGVQCDRCGVIPIVGPRYKSTKREDYDLCLNCFGDSQASESDYVKYDQPFRHFPVHGLGFHNLKPRSSFFQSHVSGRSGFGKRGGFHGRHDHRAFNHNVFGKLDSRFVRDVTIFDGTELAPGTRFTKIWRLRNSGNIPWPQNTQVVHVGGDELISESVASLELPEGGLPPDSEIEALVDLVAPESLGRYISHWRLMAPSGVKFGHRVWVSVQVVSKGEQSPQILESLKCSTENNHQHTTGEAPYRDEEDVVEENDLEKAFMESMISSCHLNSCFEANVDGPSAPLADLEGILQRDVEGSVEHNLRVEGSALEREVQKNVEGVEKFLPESCVDEDVKMENGELGVFPLPESLVDENAKVEDSELGTFSLVDAPNPIAVDEYVTSEISSKSASEILDLQAEVHPVVKEADALSDVARAALGQLEAMGFTDRTLNLELLGKHDFNVPNVLDELFSAVEWDPMMDKLQEMGFTDVDLNRRLLFKNKGSLKRVVKELVQIYKESSTWKN